MRCVQYARSVRKPAAAGAHGRRSPAARRAPACGRVSARGAFRRGGGASGREAEGGATPRSARQRTALGGTVKTGIAFAALLFGFRACSSALGAARRKAASAGGALHAASNAARPNRRAARAMAPRLARSQPRPPRARQARRRSGAGSLFYTQPFVAAGRSARAAHPGPPAQAAVQALPPRCGDGGWLCAEPRGCSIQQVEPA